MKPTYYLVHGWKVGVEVRDRAMTEMAEETRKLGMGLAISADGKEFFFGELLASVNAAAGESSVGAAVPGPDAAGRLQRAADYLGVSVPAGGPLLWVVPG